jgi:putative nucleotidyltransferase with HDIG domain
VSIGVACFPGDATDPTELVHQADLAVYRAKLQGRNRVVTASAEFELMTTETVVQPHLPEDGEHYEPLAPAPQQQPAVERRRTGRQPLPRPRFQSRRLVGIVATVATAGAAAGIAGLLFGRSDDIIGIAVVAALAGAAQALAVEVGDGSISVSAVALIAAAGLFGWRSVLPCAIAVALVEWAMRRSTLLQTCFNLGALALAALTALGTFAGGTALFGGSLAATLVVAVAASLAYFVVNTALVVAVVAEQAGVHRRALWKERFGWLFTHQVVYGAFAAALILGYRAVGVYALFVFALPLVVSRQTQSTFLEQMQRNAGHLRDAAQTIREQNISLELANRLLRERSAATMETLSATIDARDAATEGHSRRVQSTALAIGAELGLSHAELELLGHAALFHDIGKLAVPDAVLLKPERLSAAEWGLMQSHVEEGARIIERLGFLADAVPAIRHHHENYDGSGYPDHLAGEDIPLGARIVHVASAIESMLTTRRYRDARSIDGVIEVLNSRAGSQFCPRCVRAAEAVLDRIDAGAALTLAD